MNSPILKIIFNDLHLNPNGDKPIYLQLTEVLLFSIQQGKLQRRQKLPSSRDIAVFLGINRITVSKAFEELQNQGWLESFTGRGTFVSAHVPEIKPERLQDKSNKAQKTAGFHI